jgi:Flp pilus assembly protein TadG
MSASSKNRHAPARRRRLRQLWRADEGMALVEFALVATVMIFMFVGSAQLSDAISANRRVTITARALSDLASRTPTDVGSRIGELKEAQVTAILDATVQVLHPYRAANAKMRVSEVWKCAVPKNRSSNPTYDPANASLADTDPKKFNLAKCLSPYDPARAADPDNIADNAVTPITGVQWSRTKGTGINQLTAADLNLPTDIKVGTIVIQADVQYEHKPWFAGFNFGTLNLSDTIYMVPRNSRTVQLLP